MTQQTVLLHFFLLDFNVSFSANHAASILEPTKRGLLNKKPNEKSLL